jgi:hypothetical protein
VRIFLTVDFGEATFSEEMDWPEDLRFPNKGERLWLGKTVRGATVRDWITQLPHPGDRPQVHLVAQLDEPCTLEQVRALVGESAAT